VWRGWVRDGWETVRVWVPALLQGSLRNWPLTRGAVRLDAQVRASRDQLSQMNMQNLTQLEEALVGLEQTLLSGKGEEADLVLRVQRVENYVADGQLIAVRGQPPPPFHEKSAAFPLLSPSEHAAHSPSAPTNGEAPTTRAASACD